MGDVAQLTGSFSALLSDRGISRRGVQMQIQKKLSPVTRPMSFARGTVAGSFLLVNANGRTETIPKMMEQKG